MKNTIINSVFIFGVLAIFGNICMGSDFNFRKTKWGMSKNEVLKSEKIKPTCNSCYKSQMHDDILLYSSKLLAKNVTIEYGFINGQLVAASYMLAEKHTNKNDYISDLKQFKKALINKYGKPDKDVMRWKNDLYKDRPQDWGLAVSVGHLGYLSEWFEPKTDIHLYLNGDNFKVICGIWYESVLHKPKTQQFREKKEAENL